MQAQHPRTHTKNTQHDETQTQRACQTVRERGRVQFTRSRHTNIGKKEYLKLHRGAQTLSPQTLTQTSRGLVCKHGVLKLHVASSCPGRRSATTLCCRKPSRARGGGSTAACVPCRCEHG